MHSIYWASHWKSIAKISRRRNTALVFFPKAIALYLLFPHPESPTFHNRWESWSKHTREINFFPPSRRNGSCRMEGTGKASRSPSDQDQDGRTCMNIFRNQSGLDYRQRGGPRYKKIESKKTMNNLFWWYNLKKTCIYVSSEHVIIFRNVSNDCILYPAYHNCCPLFPIFNKVSNETSHMYLLFGLLYFVLAEYILILSKHFT